MSAQKLRCRCRAATTFTPHPAPDERLVAARRCLIISAHPIYGGDKAGIAQIVTHNDRISPK
jgi:hypothetical protein